MATASTSHRPHRHHITAPSPTSSSSSSSLTPRKSAALDTYLNAPSSSTTTTTFSSSSSPSPSSPHRAEAAIHQLVTARRARVGAAAALRIAARGPRKRVPRDMRTPVDRETGAPVVGTSCVGRAFGRNPGVWAGLCGGDLREMERRG